MGADDDYLQTGGAKLDQVSARASEKSAAPRAKNKTDDLYLKDYGRAFGEKITYSAGLTYGAGLFTGGAYGLVLGLQQGGSTPKLRMNAVLNAAGSKGPMLANQCATMTMFFVGSKGLLGWARGSDDEANAPVAGAVAGALYKCTASWSMIARYSVASMSLFTAADLALRYGYV
jgi:import inner membrane translocase subunit TIM23